ncbi:GNAT family N-acetyltransferase [Profundibacter amoris]|uniref:GNAT family N-acetyltransferase n=1 Tax=Profundibacter amoris TaxID=2171755 RepID=A0A347UJV4_9RHOB|nr:GNAT family N-acetyltransferase [Profundibacter amoris]AXX99132.1 GNAT family N-acetyltransferase [Profundibacter amoris]
MTPDALAALHARCFTMPRPWSAAEFAALLTSKGVFVQSTAAGFALGREIAGESELLTLAVDPALQRQGHGRRLLTAFEAESRKRGATEALLEVAATNTGARNLYESAGYRESGRRALYYTPPQGEKIDAILMCKTLI